MRLNLYFITILLFSIISYSTQGQTAVPNGNFENWTGVGGNSEEPTNWNSNKTGGGNASSAPQTCFRDVNPHSGTYCVKIKATTYITVTVNGVCATGRIQAPSFSASDGYVGTVANDANFNSPFTGRPDSLVGWYKFTAAGSSTNGTIQVNLHTGAGALPESGSYQGNTTPNVVARAIFNTPKSSVNGWTRFSVPFVYVNNSTPEYFLSVMNSGATNNNILYVDDLETIYNPTLTTGTISAGPYYVSGSTGASISVPYTAQGTYGGGNTFTAQISDASGSFASPIGIGSITGSTSGTIAATLPPGTASGTGYRIRVVSSSPVLTANNPTDITITLVNTSVAPATAQALAINVPGNQLTVTESAGVVSRSWRYAIVNGGPYTAFTPAATATTFTPQFATAGTYYVVAVSTYPGGFQTASNQVVFNVAGNSIAPTGSQSILVGGTGTLLTVTETPAGTSREWKYTTTSGSNYQSFAPAETGTTFAPTFNAGGTYYVVAQSVINGVTVTSNEVEVSVSTVNLTTGTISPAAFYFSPSAPSATVTIPYNTSSTFGSGNMFTAQLSDASGSFSNPVNIGNIAASGSGTITGTLLSSTAAGTGYRIRVISSNPPVTGSNNGVDLLVDQFNNSISPSTAQSYVLGTSGTSITINESQTASRVWKYSTTSGGPYINFSPAQTGTTYTPSFNSIGTYYVVATSQNAYSDLVTSNEVMITVVNGSTLTTTAISGSPFYVSPRSNVQVQVPFTSNIVFGVNNTFSAQLSDASGDFSNPTVIGTATSGNSINSLIPGSTLGGNGYRIRVVSTDPPSSGTDNGTDLVVIPFEITVAPQDTQWLVQNTAGDAITITPTHPSTTIEWLATATSGYGYGAFTPAETGTVYTPNFVFTGNKYVIVRAINQWGDTLTSSETVILVSKAVGIEEVGNAAVKAFWSNNALVIDLSNTVINQPTMQLFDLSGKLVAESLLNNSVNQVSAHLPNGIYILQITGTDQHFTLKTMKQ
ncbi:hypothetical protein BH09BAC1_BH09BAC1_26480 [soil metagenome]